MTTAQAAAEKAQSDANAAATKASSAQDVADAAKENASLAQTAANQAKCQKLKRHRLLPMKQK